MSSAPVITTNTVSPSTVPLGGSATWTTRATDPDADVAVLTRSVTDAEGHQTTFTAQLTVSDPLTYGTPSCDNPAVSLVVDSNDQIGRAHV